MSGASPRPQLRGPGVLHQRYVRRAAAPAVAAAPAPAAGAPGLLGSGSVVVAFIVLLFVCQLALLMEVLAAARVVFRILSFGTSLALLVLVKGPRLNHLAKPFLVASAVFTALNFFHPGTTSPLAAAAQLGIQIAVFAPFFWASRLRIDAKMFSRVVLLLFLFNMASASLGILQVSFPGRFQPNLSSVVEGQGEGYVRSLQFETASGARVFRPMGLTDVPGGAATGAFYSVLLGGTFLLSRQGISRKVLGVVGIGVGLICLYLGQVRVSAVTLLVCMAAMGLALTVSGRWVRLAALASVVGGLAVVAFGWAVAVGGDAVLSRWSTLTASDPSQVYQSNRGHFLESTFEEVLPEFPLGAGMGRYGMANAYFGDNTYREHPPLWAEIQLTAWAYDAGWLGIVCYPVALLVTLGWGFQVARRREDSPGEFWLWGSMLFAYDLGAIAQTFNNQFFMSQMGMEFWLLNGAFFSAYWNRNAAVHPHRR
ncbi:hypothetical protein D7X30_06945 [Corallococcus sp. AB011P]|uniref:hypothetical protein n=1 Tax=unclassified Corallococcus TaxID=2685029 RepID=UPI000EA07484|nr:MULTISPECIES: hypothetical protein [unclassified Corallococcus]RKG60659.1 hypothetical protein D7X30_06945 [Corallococcus sp. AB011P]RKH78916.1 hypothetical protein D7Y21_34880 [Corallococcus sp. AB045]